MRRLMAKRFGRNQKRKLLEQLKTQQELTNKYLNRLDNIDSEYQNIKYFYDNAKGVVNHWCALFPEKAIELGLGERYVLYPTSSDFSDFCNVHYKNEPYDKRIVYGMLHIIKSEVFKDYIDNVLHVRVNFPDKTIGYAVSDNYMASTAGFENIVRNVAMQITQEYYKMKDKK